MRLQKFILTACIAAAVTFCAVPAFAEEMPVEKATKDKATVSDELDTADPSMETNYYMYIEPDLISKDIPKMGVDGFSTELLLAVAAVAGISYLGVSAYAYSGEESCPA